ncbi:DUF1156 domain-containing protein [Nonomuraea sp. NPDC048892]|uniref:DUF1156 domain-containing protein n=1 Tax=Nonomuraea sp. NPDC048892 TaxID=3154624 RepID=UPI0033E8230F
MNRKLIEVALPLDDINAACKADKDRKTGTIRNLHKWFAPMPLPAWRALLFAALVDDPGDEEKRIYLLDVIKRLVANGADLPDDDTLAEAREILAKQFPAGVPIVMDPFCGGGSTLMEAQRLGLPTYGSDLNPVPVLISRTLTELLPKVYGQQPLHPEPLQAPKPKRGRGKLIVRDEQEILLDTSERVRAYSGYKGVARDVIYYAERIRNQAWEKLKHAYPAEPGETPVAWLWARTAICPSPACGIETLLSTSWWLSKRKNELAWIQPRVESKNVHLDVISGQRVGGAPPAAKIGDGVFACVACGATLDGDHLRIQGQKGRIGFRMTAVVSEITVQGKTVRIYRTPTPEELRAASEVAITDDSADVPINVNGQGIRVGPYGINTWAALHTPRQLLCLATFANLVADIHSTVISDGGSREWADAVSSMLGLALGKRAQFGSTQSGWKLDSRSGTGKAERAFPRNDLPMTWDFAEANPLARGAGSWLQCVDTMLASLSLVATGVGTVQRFDARVSQPPTKGLVATDPPYFDAIGYADLSDYFYVWHRQALRTVHSDLYGTVATPKTGELTAIPSRHGGSRDAAKQYFIDGFTETFVNLQKAMLPELPMLVVYASKEQNGGKDEQSRWASILTAMIDAGLEITGTWPILGTGGTRLRGLGSSAVATYVVMAARLRSPTATSCSLGEFTKALRRELGSAVRDLQATSILPVDMAQAVMGPGMSIYSRYAIVAGQSGARVDVDAALRLINSVFGEVQEEQEGELDSESQFAVTWWQKHGWAEGPFGEADQLARAKGISVDDVMRAQVVTSKGGKVAVLGGDVLDRGWDPLQDDRPTAWEAVHHLADRLIDGGGEVEAAALLQKVTQRGVADSARALTYRLAAVAAKTKRTKDEERYNALIDAWTRLASSAQEGLF